jgi:hypothetical protein
MKITTFRHFAYKFFQVFHVLCRKLVFIGFHYFITNEQRPKFEA